MPNACQDIKSKELKNHLNERFKDGSLEEKFNQYSGGLHHISISPGASV